MAKLSEFEASLLEMLIDKCTAGREDVAELLKTEPLDGRTLVQRAIDEKLVPGGRLARLISQYWELPLVDVAFPYRRFLVHFSRPIDDLLACDLLPLEFAPGELTVVSYYIPDEQTLRAIEQTRLVRVQLYIAAYRSVQEALLRLRDEVRRFHAAEPVDCGTDKDLFCEVTDEGLPALVREHFAGGTIVIEFDKARRLSKTVESLDPSEPEAVSALLLGKQMVTTVSPEEDLRRLVGDFVETVGRFDGELSEAILKLRVAQMMLDPEDGQ
jgi:hypothetical protein